MWISFYRFFMLAVVILIISVIIQIVSVIYVSFFVQITGYRNAWLTFAFAFLFRAVRNILFLLDYFQNSFSNARLAEEIFGLVISVLFFIGLIKIKPIFLHYQKIIEDLDATQKKYLAILRGSLDGIVIIQDGKIKFANPRTIDLLGYPEQDILEKRFSDFVESPFKSLVEEKYQLRIKGKIANEEQYEIPLIQKTGKKILLEMNVSLIEYLDKPAILVIGRDVTVRKQKEKSGNGDSAEINRILIGRELKMVELKKENEELRKKIIL